MTISIGSDQFKNIVEIWGSGPNTLHVVTASYRTIRVSALGNIRSGTAISRGATVRSRATNALELHCWLQVDSDPPSRLKDPGGSAETNFPTRESLFRSYYWRAGAGHKHAELRHGASNLVGFEIAPRGPSQ